MIARAFVAVGPTPGIEANQVGEIKGTENIDQHDFAPGVDIEPSGMPKVFKRLGN